MRFELPESPLVNTVLAVYMFRLNGDKEESYFAPEASHNIPPRSAIYLTKMAPLF
jgi:hypothetical protein